MIPFILIMMSVVCLICYGFLHEYNKLVDKYNEQQKLILYYKNLFAETLKHKRILEKFINEKINPNLHGKRTDNIG